MKWYSSLFVKRNATKPLGLTNSDIDTLIYPWSLIRAQPFAQYFGLGVEVLYVQNAPASPPPFPASQQQGINYMGGSMCQFFSIVLWLANFSIFDPSIPLATYPIISVTARNNRILNVSKSNCAFHSCSTLPAIVTESFTMLPQFLGVLVSCLLQGFLLLTPTTALFLMSLAQPPVAGGSATLTSPTHLASP